MSKLPDSFEIQKTTGAPVVNLATIDGLWPKSLVSLLAAGTYTFPESELPRKSHVINVSVAPDRNTVPVLVTLGDLHKSPKAEEFRKALLAPAATAAGVGGGPTLEVVDDDDKSKGMFTHTQIIDADPSNPIKATDKVVGPDGKKVKVNVVRAGGGVAAAILAHFGVAPAAPAPAPVVPAPVVAPAVAAAMQPFAPVPAPAPAAATPAPVAPAQAVAPVVAPVVAATPSSPAVVTPTPAPVVPAAATPTPVIPAPAAAPVVAPVAPVVPPAAPVVAPTPAAAPAFGPVAVVPAPAAATPAPAVAPAVVPAPAPAPVARPTPPPAAPAPTSNNNGSNVGMIFGALASLASLALIAAALIWMFSSGSGGGNDSSMAGGGGNGNSGAQHSSQGCSALVGAVYGNRVDVSFGGCGNAVYELTVNPIAGYNRSPQSHCFNPNDSVDTVRGSTADCPESKLVVRNRL